MSCNYCGGDMSHKREGAKFCSDSCKVKFSKKNNKEGGLRDIPFLSSHPIPPKGMPLPMPPPQAQSFMPVVSKTALAFAPKPLGDAAVAAVRYMPSMSDGQVIAGLTGLVVGLVATPKLVEKPAMSDYLFGGVGGALLGTVLQWLVVDRVRERRYEQEQQRLYQEQQLSDKTALNQPKLVLGGALRYHSTPSIEFNTPILSEIAPRYNVGFKMLIHGQASNGKSTIASHIARELLSKGRILFVLSEEVISTSVGERIKKSGLLTDEVVFLETTNVQDVYSALQRYQFEFIIIDSISALLPSYDEQVRFVNNIKSHDMLGYIFIVQETKGGQMRGSNELHHAGDITLNIVNFQVQVEKNRFGKSGVEFDPQMTDNANIVMLNNVANNR